MDLGYLGKGAALRTKSGKDPEFKEQISAMPDNDDDID